MRSIHRIQMMAALLATVAGSARADMLVPTNRVGSSDWGAGESVNQLFDGTPTVGSNGGLAGYWDSGGEFNLIAWMDFDEDFEFSAVDFSTENSNDGFNRIRLWIRNDLATFTVVNGSTPPTNAPDLDAVCAANGNNFAQYTLPSPITARYVVAQFLSERITDTSIYHPRGWELRMEGTPATLPPPKVWNVAGGGTWGVTNNWNPMAVPQAVGDSACFGEIIGAASVTVTLDGNRTVSGVTFTNTAGGHYTVAAGSPAGTLTLQWSGTALITVSAGAHQISAPITLAGKAGVVAATNTTLTLTGTLTGGGYSFLKNGAGTLVIPGIDSFGTTTLSGGVLSADTLGNSSNLVFNGGTLRYTGVTATSDRSFVITDGKTAVIDVATAGRTLTLSQGAPATGGGLAKTGAGVLELSAANNYTGATTVGAGTLKLGASGSIAGTNITIAAGGVLDVTAQSSYDMAGGNVYTFGVDPARTGTAAGRLDAAGLVISNAHVVVDIVGSPRDPVYVLATYTSLEGTNFASVAGLPPSYGIQYLKGNQIVMARPYTGTVLTVR